MLRHCSQALNCLANVTHVGVMLEGGRDQQPVMEKKTKKKRCSILRANTSGLGSDLLRNDLDRTPARCVQAAVVQSVGTLRPEHC